MKTLQEIFDFGLNHIRTQGVLCMDDKGNCLYRNAEGQACIVGGFIPEHLYDPMFDELVGCFQSATSYAQGDGERADISNQFMDVLRSQKVDVDDGQVVDLLAEMQLAHDAADDLANFETLMSDVAVTHSLDYKEPV